ncbi:MAG: ABC transporter ATP-binding protein [Pseudothermotoga sp.]
MNVLHIKDLTVRYTVNKKQIRAVEDLNLSVEKGRFVGVVGESGSGKSTLAHAIMRLLPKNARIIKGKIELFGQDIISMSDHELAKIRWKEFSMVFQRSMNALSPVHKVGIQMSEALTIHNPQMNEEKIRERLESLLSMVNLPVRVLDCYPHQLSGGMMQRVMIALALVNSPKFVILDEATTALDVVTQGQIIEELKILIQKFSLTGMVISHDLGVVAELCDDIAVMYAGRLMEFGNKDEVIQKPLHPYTKALVSSLPELSERGGRLYSIPGNLPDLSCEINGCVFANRCQFVSDECFKMTPLTVGFENRYVSCLKVGNESCKYCK